MKKFLDRLFGILSLNTLLALLVATGSTYLSILYGLKIDFPLTIIGIAVVFPIVFSIGWAYNRREAALVQYGIMKSMSRSMYLASRDWLRDNWEAAENNKKDFKETTQEIFELCIKLFQSKPWPWFLHEEKLIYSQFSKLSRVIEDLRDRWLSGSEVSRLNAHHNRFMTAFEVLKHIYQYRTPRTLRLYSKLFIYIVLIILWPYFALLATGQALWLSMIMPIVFAMVLTGLDNIQELLENPFDQVWEDDIKINPHKIISAIED